MLVFVFADPRFLPLPHNGWLYNSIYGLVEGTGDAQPCPHDTRSHAKCGRRPTFPGHFVLLQAAP